MPAGGGQGRRILKIVIFDQRDLDWAQDVAARYPRVAAYLQPGNSETDPAQPVDPQDLADRMLWLVDQTVGQGLAAATDPAAALHVLIWATGAACDPREERDYDRDDLQQPDPVGRPDRIAANPKRCWSRCAIRNPMSAIMCASPRRNSPRFVR